VIRHEAATGAAARALFGEYMDLVAARVGAQYPEVKDWGIHLFDFRSWIVSNDLRTALLVLLSAVGFVLLIACANIANLLLSRAASRQKEIAVRTALGASRGRMLGQLLTESLLLSAAGGAAGLLAALWTVQLMNRSLPPGVLPVPEVSIDSAVLLFALAVTLATGLLFGLAPAWHAAKADLNSVLKQGSRSSVGGQRLVVRNGLVAGELALATMLLIGAGLLMQSLARLQRVELGFRPDNLLTFQLAPPAAKYPGNVKPWALYREMLQSLNTIPGVRGAAISSGIPMGGGSYTRTPMIPYGKSILPDGTVLPTGSGDSVPDNYYFAAAFLDTIGYFDAGKRFWTDKPLPDGSKPKVLNGRFPVDTLCKK